MDAGKARAYARDFLVNYAKYPNSTNNWKRDGFTEQDVGGH